MKRYLTALTLSGAALIMTATPATAIQLPDPPMPGIPPAAVEQGPPNYPGYDPAYEVVPAAGETSSLDSTSVALGALGGIALAGAGLGVTLGVQRRRDHAVA